MKQTIMITIITMLMFIGSTTLAKQGGEKMENKSNIGIPLKKYLQERIGKMKTANSKPTK